MGLERSAPTSWEWMEIGLEERRKSGLASFWHPANRKVTPRKRRRGRRYHPVAMEPSGRRTRHREPCSTGSDEASDRCAAARTRLDAFEVTGSIPWRARYRL